MKVKRLFFILFFLSLFTVHCSLFTVSAWAIFEERPSSARAWGMGGAFTAVADDSSAIYFNPAGLGQLKMIELSGSYTMLYGEKDLEYKLGNLALPMGRLGTIGLATTNYGHRKLREDAYIFSYGRKFTFEKQDIYLGGNAKYLRLEIETVGKEFDYGGDLGLLYKLLDGKLSLGLFGGNVNTPHIGDDLPQRYAGGIAYRPDPDLILAVDYHYEKQEKEEDDEFRLGLEYHWLKYLFLRSGVANNPGRWMVGWGLRNRFLSFDYAYLPHHNLDETHLGTLTFRFGGPKKRKEEKPPIVEIEEVPVEEVPVKEVPVEEVPVKEVPVEKPEEIEKPEVVPVPEEKVVPISSITEASIGQKVTLKGKIMSVRIFKKEKGRTLELNDGTGSIDVLIWKELYESLLYRQSLVQGMPIQVSGRVASYKDKFEIKLKKPSDIQILETELVPIGKITEASIGQRVTIKGKIISVRVFKEEKGRTLKIDDGTGSINVVIWKDLYESIPERESLVQGTSIQVSGQIGSYANELEIRPKDLSDIQIIEIEEEVSIPEEEVEVPVKPERVVEKININTASRTQLETLPGIGPVKALAIIAHRPYERIEDLRSVPGIGAKRYEVLKDLITIEPEKVEEPEEEPPGTEILILPPEETP